MKKKDIKKLALVTGASSGIGKALAIELLNRGYEVIGISRSDDKLEHLKEVVKSDYFYPYPCDVSDLLAVKDLSLKLQNMGMIPQIFFLNAGIAGESAMDPKGKLEIAHHRRVFDVNYYGVLNFVSEWPELCKEKAGATFVVSNSINAIFAPPYGCAYSASKAAISKAFDSLRVSSAHSNLKFLSIFCGPVDTAGLLGKLPFTWSTKKMANYIIKRAEKGKARSYPSLFYTLLARFLNLLSEKKVIWFLKLFSRGGN